MNPHRSLTLTGAALGILAGLTTTLARHLPSERDLPVKNLITGNARAGVEGVKRKVREALIARRIERATTKDEILAAYLNQMDFGTTDGVTAIGIVQAARKYFGKQVKDLNLYEIAM